MTEKFFLPDTGSNSPVEVIEIHVRPDQIINEGESLLTLESDKASIDVPAPKKSIVNEILVKVGDKIKTGDAIFVLTPAENETLGATKKEEIETQTPPSAIENTSAEKLNKNSSDSNFSDTSKTVSEKISAPTESTPLTNNENTIFAGPGIRRLARLLGVDLNKIQGTGSRGRITAEDIQNFVKQILQSPAETSGFLPRMPEIDFSLFGEIEKKELTRIKRITAQNLSRNWLLAPHVTQFDEADITALEKFRKEEGLILKNSGIKLTLLAFVMKAVVKNLKQFPQFNASLDPTGHYLIYKKYYHLGIAVNTDEGLIVPVIRDVDQKTIVELAQELTEISQQARDKKLASSALQGSSFTISSLGGIGGTAFTPIINLPNVAILGLSKSQIKPIYDGNNFQPRLMLPLSLSYDHRVIDGAEAAEFIVSLKHYLENISRLLL